jgi:hypothetical protein
MENYSKLIDSVFKKLDWNYIMKYFDARGELEEDETTSKKGKRVRVNSKNIVTIKKELKDLVKFVVDSNFNELQHDNWIIFWSNKESGYRLEIIFTPTRAVMSEKDNIDEEEIFGSDEVERNVLVDMLNKSIREENYELAGVINSRIKKLDKIIKSSSNKKSDIY